MAINIYSNPFNIKNSIGIQAKSPTFQSPTRSDAALELDAGSGGTTPTPTPTPEPETPPGFDPQGQVLSIETRSDGSVWHLVADGNGGTYYIMVSGPTVTTGTGTGTGTGTATETTAEGSTRLYDGVTWTYTGGNWVETPKEGEQKTVGGVSFTYTGGQWVNDNTTTATPETPTTPETPATPVIKEGTTRIVNGVTQTYVNGNWEETPREGEKKTVGSDTFTYTNGAWINDASNTSGTPDTIAFEYEYDTKGRITRIWRTVNGVKDATPYADYTSVWGQLDNASGMQANTFEDWMKKNGYTYQTVADSPEYQGLQGLIAQLQSTETSTGDQDASDLQAGKSLGFTGTNEEILAEYRSYKGGTINGQEDWFSNQAQNGFEGYAGLGETDQANYERMVRNQAQSSEQEAQRALDQVLSGATGNSTQRALMLSNEYTKTIQDAQLQSSVELATLNYDRRLAEFQADYTDYQTRLSMGQTTATQVLEELQNNRYQALQGYATDINAILTQDQQYLTMYGQELERVQQAVDQIYKGIELELNTIDEAISTKVQEAFDQYWADYAANKQKRDEAGDDAWQGILDILTILASIFSIKI